jgi:hypothetical protein
MELIYVQALKRAILSAANFSLFFPLTAFKILARIEAMTAFFALLEKKIIQKFILNLILLAYLIIKHMKMLYFFQMLQSLPFGL